MNNVQRVFKKSKRIIIGAVHFPPLLGYKNFPGFDVALQNAKKDIRAFESGGASATIIENNYDIPHSTLVGSETVASMAILGKQLVEFAKKPMGINVLWNDYLAGFSIAKSVGLSFIRVPVFVDTVKTECGVIRGNPKDVRNFRKKIGAENILLLADIHVKHAKLLSRLSLAQSAMRAFQFGADAVIVTGDWTGEAPKMRDLQIVRSAIGKSKALLVGSGADNKNIADIFSFADGVIVSTSLKTGGNTMLESNVKKYSQRIDVMKVRKFVASAGLRK